jgi:D-amino-acid dehydrogenase
MDFDAMVLGAGIVGTSIAVRLQRRGAKAALIDRKAPGNETSLGNAGIIQREGVYPYAFPRDLATISRYASNRATDVRYHAAAMPKLLPFLLRYWHHSRPDRHAKIARAYSALIGVIVLFVCMAPTLFASFLFVMSKRSACMYLACQK